MAPEHGSPKDETAPPVEIRPGWDPLAQTFDPDRIDEVARQQTSLLATVERVRLGGFETEAKPATVDPRSRPLAADTFEQRYGLQQVLGEGGMGEVRLGKDRLIGREVALKFMRTEAERVENEGFCLRERFEREARIQGQLEHPSVVPVYDLGVREDGSVYFSMRRVRGHTLEQIIESLNKDDPETKETFTQHRLLSAFTTVCLTIEYAHRRKVVHRDLKPANIILGEFGEVYLLDWGIAKVVDPKADPLALTTDDSGAPTVRAGAEQPKAIETTVGTMLGTPGYMAPEQASGDPSALSPRVDVYALGAILFEFLTLKPLHPYSDTHRILLSTLRGPDIEAQLRAASVAPELAEICKRATALAPSDRYTSARQLYEAIEDHLAGSRQRRRNRQQASDQVQQAEKALNLASSDHSHATAHRARAVQALTAALALDSKNEAALKTLLRVLTQAGEHLSPEGEAEFRANQDKMRLRGGRLGAIGILSFLAFVPLIFWVGIRNSDALWAVAASFDSLCLFAWFTAGIQPIPKWRQPIVGLLGAAVFCSMVPFWGPLLFVPTVALGFGLTFIVNMRARRPLRLYVMALMVLVLILPTILQTVGWLPASYETDGQRLSVLPWALEIGNVQSLWILLAATAVTIVVIMALMGRWVDNLCEAERKIFAQAWNFKRWLGGSSENHDR